MYIMEIQPDKKTLFIKVGGFFKEEEAKAYIHDYQKNTKKIKPSEYKLVIDARDQAAVLPEVAEDLKHVLNMYSDTDFKEIFIVNPTSTVSKMQLAKCAKEISFRGKLVDTIESV